MAKKYGLIIDVTRCDGCGSCLLAVKDEYVGNDYPGYCATQPNEGQNWLDLVEVEQGQGTKIKMDYIPVMYKHDRNFVAPEGIPEGAMYVREDGLTIIDPVKSKGCKQIVDDCKDGTIFWNEELQIPQIYTLDAHRMDEGEKYPRCVESCPTQAMFWGDLNDPESDVSKFIAMHEGEIEDYMPEEGADYVVRYYKLPKPFVAGEVLLCDSDDCVKDAKVTLTCGKTGNTIETTTDFLGDFEFKYLFVGGKYTVKVEYPGYQPVELEVTTDTAKNLGEIVLNK